MNFEKNSGHSMFDGFDCPQKLDSLALPKVDDSWFVNKSSAEQKKTNHPQREPSTEADEFSTSLSTINEKENIDASAASITMKSSCCKSSESPPQPHCLAGAAAAAASTTTTTTTLTTLLTEAAGPLATASRCQQRFKWEALRIQRERRFEQLRQQRKDSVCRHEQESVQLLRSAAVPKAQPIRHYKPIRIHRSDRPLTVAKSPDFALARRERHKPSSDQPE